MPELAEVAFFARQWNAGMDASVMRVTTHSSARVFRESPAKRIASTLKGQALTEILTAGKQAAFRFSTDIWLGIHLGMSGRLFTDGSRENLAPWAEGDKPPQPTHDRLVLHMSNGTALVFNDPRMFGLVRLYRGDTTPPWWAAIPPALSSPLFTLDVLKKVLDSHPGVLLKSLLLDQRYFPGIGNWMADEIMWRTRLSPHNRVRALGNKEVRLLYKTIREVCNDAMEVVSKSWYPAPDNWLFNHRWKRGGRCPRDGASLLYEQIGGRTACWCEKCQRQIKNYELKIKN
ncbi:MAG: hypothetical protein LBV12_12875 [Puniceicoccales bacterium]|jgi:formamidopyrimidine-DNA glycosylase|nr:hypothetical protein [Puniceicoccales bacterium]